MEGYLLYNDDGQFVCRNHSNKIYMSSTDFQNAAFYLHLKNACNVLSDEHYWRHRNIDYKNFKAVKVKISIDIL